MKKKSPKKSKSLKRKKNIGKKSPKKNYYLQGGVKLNEGEFGMVYDYTPGKVIKIFFERPAENRYTQSIENFIKMKKRLLEIDPQREFFNIVYEQRDFTISELEKIDNQIVEDLMLIFTTNSIDLPGQKKSSFPLTFYCQIFDKVYDPPNILQWNGEQMRHMLKALFILHNNNLVHKDLHFTYKEIYDASGNFLKTIYAGNVMFKNNLPIMIDLDTVKEVENDDEGLAEKYRDFERLFFNILLTPEDKQRKYIPSVNSNNIFMQRLNSPNRNTNTNTLFSPINNINNTSFFSPTKNNNNTFFSPINTNINNEEEENEYTTNTYSPNKKKQRKEIPKTPFGNSKSSNI